MKTAIALLLTLLATNAMAIKINGKQKLQGQTPDGRKCEVNLYTDKYKNLIEVRIDEYNGTHKDSISFESFEIDTEKTSVIDGKVFDFECEYSEKEDQNTTSIRSFTEQKFNSLKINNDSNGQVSSIEGSSVAVHKSLLQRTQLYKSCRNLQKQKFSSRFICQNLIAR